MPDEKRCDLQILINMWHGQAPYTNVCVHNRPCIVLQLERFPDVAKKHNAPVDFSRAEVHISIFNNSIGQDVSWVQYRVVAVLCHFGAEPWSDHYQCLFINSDSTWMTDDGRGTVRCPVVDPIRRAAYMYWLVPQEALNTWWRRPVEESVDLSDLLATAFSN